MREIINDTLSITLPEGFRAMAAEEIEQGYAADFANMRGFWDQGRHVIITITWNESNGLFTKLTNAKALAKRAQKHLARSYARLGYRDGGLFPTTIAGRDAYGVRYGYTVEGVAHDAETIVFLEGNCCYTLYYYCHSEDATANAALHDDVLGSLSFSQ